MGAPLGVVVDLPPAKAQAPGQTPLGQVVDVQPWAGDPGGYISKHVGGPVQITSGYRTPQHNAAVGGVRNSAHQQGDAFDFTPPKGMSMSDAASRLAAAGIPFDQIITEPNHVHVSFDPRGRRQVLGAAEGQPVGEVVDLDASKHLGQVVDLAPRPGAGPARPALAPPSPGGGGADTALSRVNRKVPFGVDPVGDIRDAAVGSWQAGQDARQRQKAAMAKGDLGGTLKAGGERVLDALGVAGSPFAAVSEPVARLLNKIPTETKHVVDHGRGRFTMEGPSELTPEQQAEQAEGAAGVLTALPGGEGALAESVGRVVSLAKGGAKADRLARAAADAGKVVGTEKDPIVRADNALYRLGGHATADQIEAKQFLEKLPKEVKDPRIQEKLYTAIEQKLVDPKAKVPAELKKPFEAFMPWYKEQTAIINRLRQRADPDLEPYLEEQGYVPRRVQGHSPAFDPADPDVKPKDPILGGRRNLAKTTTAMKGRRFLVLEDESGKRTFVAPDRKDAKEWKPGMTVRGSFDKPMKVRQATTAEVEANTDTRYHKNALINTVDNVLRLRRVERNLEVLEDVTKGMKDQGLAHQDFWFRPGEKGERIEVRANGRKPEGYVELPHIPQLRGWSFDPKVAEVLKDYRPAPDEPIDGVLAKVNRALTASLFITPVPHALNVGAHWMVGRGWDWMSPGGYKRLMQTGSRAVGETLTLGPKYRQMLREGSGLLYGDTQTRDFYKVMMQKGVSELVDDPKAFAEMKKSFDLGSMSPIQVGKAIYTASNKALWFMNDIFMLQRQMELEAKGLPTREAIRLAEEDIPNYRIPPRVMGSRALNQAMKNNTLMMFGRYKYGQLKAWGSMFRDIYKGSAEEKREALGKFLVAAIVAYGVYPTGDAALQFATGNKNARLRRAGPFSLTDAATRLEQGQIGWAQAMGSFLTPAPATETALEIKNNRDSFSGRPIMDPQSTTAGKIAQGAEYAAGSFYPAQLGMEAMKPGGAASAAGRLVGLDIPPASRESGRVRALKRQRAEARSRERKDELTKKLKELGVR